VNATTCLSTPSVSPLTVGPSVSCALSWAGLAFVLAYFLAGELPITHTFNVQHRFGSTQE
jgi:hypothetical protein